MKVDLTAEELRQLLRYDPETGSFWWAVKRRGRRLGSAAGSTMANGYRSVGINGTDYLCHRLAWLYVHGEWPKGFIDHINGSRSDNRIENLRDVDQSTNMQNVKGPRRDNKYGYLGVSLHKASGKYTARITSNGRYLSLGLHATPELASQAYLAAKRQLHAGGTL